MMLTGIVIGAGVVALLWTLRQRLFGFAAQSPEDYKATTPALDLRQHLNGPIACDGMIYGPTGRVASRFIARFEASWDGDSGQMHEHFRYDNGNTQDRHWTLTLEGDGRVRAEAPDLVGPGHGQLSGSTLRLDYRIRLGEAAGGHVLDVTDWMILLENGSIMNRSEMRKFGIKVAELVAVMRPEG